MSMTFASFAPQALIKCDRLGRIKAKPRGFPPGTSGWGRRAFKKTCENHNAFEAGVYC